MSIIEKHKALLLALQAKAKSRGVRFGKRELKRLKFAGAKSLGDMFSLSYGLKVTLNEQGELVFSNPIMDLIPSSRGLLDMIAPDPNWSSKYYQPVVMGTSHGLKYGNEE
jgi:hypothetical protein